MSHHFVISLLLRGVALTSSVYPAKHWIFTGGFGTKNYLNTNFTSLPAPSSILLHLFPPTLGVKPSTHRKLKAKELATGEHNLWNQISTRSTCACKFQFALPASKPHTPANQFPRILIKRQQQRAVMMAKSNLFKREKETTHKPLCATVQMCQVTTCSH